MNDVDPLVGSGDMWFTSPIAGWTVAAVLLTAIALVAAAVVVRRKARVEDPARLGKFVARVESLQWTPEKADASLDSLSKASIELFRAEVDYYYQSRAARRRASVLFRWAAFAFGTAGVLCPFLEMTVPSWAGVSRLGYLLLAIAAASLAGNELFGGTRGHVRSVTAQYELELLLNRFVIDWQQWRSRAGADAPGYRDGGFLLLRQLSADVYKVLLDETREWGTAVLDAERAYKAGMARGAKHQNG